MEHFKLNTFTPHTEYLFYMVYVITNENNPLTSTPVLLQRSI